MTFSSLGTNEMFEGQEKAINQVPHFISVNFEPRVLVLISRYDLLDNQLDIPEHGYLFDSHVLYTLQT
jgi:hypothetical protein